jgi:hypothetical protein
LQKRIHLFYNSNHMPDPAISKLFKARDRAIATLDEELFLSTQVGEIPNSSFDVYMKIDKLESKILLIYSEKETSHKRVVFVRETYSPQAKNHYSWFVIFYLIDTKAGWKIYRLAY